VIAVLAIIFWPDYLRVSPAVKVILFAGLITASFSATLIEHFFTKPTDVVANSTAALLMLLPAREDLTRLGWLFWAIAAYYIAMILIASAAILIFSFSTGTSQMLNVSQILKTTAIKLGSFKIIYGLAFYSTLFMYVSNTSTMFLVLAVYFMAILILEPNAAFTFILRAFRDTDTMAVGDVFGVQARSMFLAKLRPNRRPLVRFQSVTFRYKLDEGIRNCLVVDNYLLNAEQWVKLAPITTPGTVPYGAETNVVYHNLNQQNDAIVDRIIGTVVEGSTIGTIRFEYSSRRKVFQGKLVEVQLGEQKILYQIVQGTTVEEILERKNKSGAITGEAAQLGVWNQEKQRFERYGWVPEINALVLEPTLNEATPIAANEVELGTIPGTNYPVIMNMDDAITHHLAVFGVTGSGKSVFTRWLLQRYVDHGALVICIDNTQEYQKKLSPNVWGALMSAADNDYIRDRIDKIAREMEKFPNQRNLVAMRTWEDECAVKFTNAVNALGAQIGIMGILNLPDLSSTIEGLEYIRVFFSTIFQKARAGTFGDRKICIVIEEAHTVVPEWNFGGGGDEKRSQALVNTISQIALQGRKYNVGLLVIGQRTANVAKTVLTQCNSVVAFQQFDPTGLEFFSHYMGRGFADGLSVLQSRHAVAVGKAFAAGVPLIFQVPEIQEFVPPAAAQPGAAP